MLTRAAAGQPLTGPLPSHQPRNAWLTHGLEHRVTVAVSCRLVAQVNRFASQLGGSEQRHLSNSLNPPPPYLNTPTLISDVEF